MKIKLRDWVTNRQLVIDTKKIVGIRNSFGFTVVSKEDTFEYFVYETKEEIEKLIKEIEYIDKLEKIIHEY